MRIVVVRHGQSEGNVALIIQGHIDSPLSEKGVEQAHRAGKELNETYKFDKIYTSDLQRAAKTAEIIASYSNITDITYSSNLREFSFGDFEGRKSLEITKEEDAFLKSCWEDVTKRVPGGESTEEMTARIKITFDEITKSHSEDSTILVVCHGGTLFHILKRILDVMPETDEWFTNCSINELIHDRTTNKWKLIRFDNKYLEKC